VNILVTGGTGLIGGALVRDLMNKGHDLIILTRDKSKAPSDIRAVENLKEIDAGEVIDVVINLAGAPINKRWSSSYKKVLVSSRVQTTKNVIEFIKKVEHKPELLITASAVGYYGSQEGAVLDEAALPRNEFTYQLCKGWEQEALKAQNLGVRVCIARLGVVLSKRGGILSQMRTPFKLGLGGKIGNGKQYLSWVHIDDVVSAFNFFIEDKKQSGAFNVTSPNPVENVTFTKALGRQLNRPTLFQIPGIVVKLVFAQMGETLLLKGQRVIPSRLRAAGFKFQYVKIEQALKGLI
jgi:uncharacterized protein (TIGR01777 family)